MRIIFFLIVIILLPLFASEAQTAREFKATDPLPLQPPGVTAPMSALYPSREGWELAYSMSRVDIQTDGRVDTTYGATTVYIGSLIPTFQLGGFPSIALLGMDSADVSISYRHVAIGANRAIAAGEWIFIDTVLFRNSRTSVLGAGGGADSLAHAEIDSAMRANFFDTETGYIQLRYEAESQKANAPGGGEADILRPSATQNYTWKGQSIITARRTTR